MDNKLKLKQNLERFVNSDQETQDYMNLFYAVNTIVQTKSGLIWSDVRDIVDNTLREQSQVIPSFIRIF